MSNVFQRIIVVTTMFAVSSLAAGQDATGGSQAIENVVSVENVQVVRDSEGVPALIEFDLVNLADRGIIAFVPVFSVTPDSKASPDCHAEEWALVVTRGVALGSPLRSIAPQEVLHMKEEPSGHLQCSGAEIQVEVKVDLVVFEDMSYAGPNEKDAFRDIRSRRAGSNAERYFLKRLLERSGPDALVRELQRQIGPHNHNH